MLNLIDRFNITFNIRNTYKLSGYLISSYYYSFDLIYRRFNKKDLINRNLYCFTKSNIRIS
jgi:hypothetical protein